MRTRVLIRRVPSPINLPVRPTLSTAMQIQLDKARKLIDRLEKALNETATHTESARTVISQWISNGEATLRAKSASALKQVRKRADRFTEALNDLEKSLAKSLDKLSDEVAGKPKAAAKAKSKAKPAPAAKAAPKKALPAAKKAPAAKPAAKPAAAKGK